MNVKIREAYKGDSRNLIKLIRELAKFEKLKPPATSLIRKMMNDSEGTHSAIKILVAECDEKLVGYAIYCFTYSSFLAKKTLYLEDIYISEKHRSDGIGKLFMKRLTSIAKRNRCGRMEWIVLKWNKKAIKFYDKLGAEAMNEWKFYRMTI